MTRLILVSSAAALLALTACRRDDTDDTDGPDPFDAFAEADLTDPELVVDLANNSSAPRVYTLAVIFGAALENEDGLCPTRSEADGVTTWTGGCTDADGDVWVGSATVTHLSESTGVIEYDGLGRTSTDPCVLGGTVQNTTLYDGRVEILDEGRFAAVMSGSGTDVDEQACTATTLSFALDYAGQQIEQTQALSTWSGSGRYGDSVKGRVSASTTAEVLDDDGCDSEAESGTTKMEAGGHTVVITYDGANDCDPESTVTWTLDGTDKGELTGVRCGPAVPAGGLPVVLAGLLLGLRRRR